MSQQGQLIQLKRRGRDGQAQWAYRSLGKAVAVFGERPVAELRSEEIAAWRIALSPGYRFDATQALRQVLARAVAVPA